MFIKFFLVTLALNGLSSNALAQNAAATIRLTYEVLKGDVVTANFDQTKEAGFFPLIYKGQSAIAGRKVATPMRLQGCARHETRGTYNVEFNDGFGPEGLPAKGSPDAQVSLQIGGYPWDRSVRYGGAGTYAQHWNLGPKKVAKSWQFRQKGKPMWDQIVHTNPGAASVTVNRDERSGTFLIGPYSDKKGQPWTVRGTFSCSQLMTSPKL
jgi:hypothetical protein